MKLVLHQWIGVSIILSGHHLPTQCWFQLYPCTWIWFQHWICQDLQSPLRAKQDQRFLDESDFLDSCQYYFKPESGTETGKVSLVNDLKRRVTGGSAPLLICLYLSAAFDTIVLVLPDTFLNITGISLVRDKYAAWRCCCRPSSDSGGQGFD